MSQLMQMIPGMSNLMPAGGQNLGISNFQMVGFIGSGDTLETLGLQDSSCSHMLFFRWISDDLLRWQVPKRRVSRGSSGSWPEA